MELETSIDYEFLHRMDDYCHIDNISECEQEINSIVSCLWSEIGEHENLFSPMFTTFLQTNLLRPLYIYYFSMLNLIRCADRVYIQDTNFIIDIIAKHLGLPLSNKRKCHDADFYLERNYSFSHRKEKHGLGLARKIRAFIKRSVHIYQGVDVLYLNSGKLEKDFSEIDNSMDALHVPFTRIDSIYFNVESVINQSIDNIQRLQLSIPVEIVVALLNRSVYRYLPGLVKRINAYVSFIKRYHVRLVIVSAIEHEDHLALLAAAKAIGVQSLVIGHGYNPWKTSFSDKYVSYQGTISSLEYKYQDAHQYDLKMEWFNDRKV